MIIGAYLGGPDAAIAAAFGAFLGHLFPAWLGHPALAELFALLTVLLWLAHRTNIRQLLAGTEGKIGAKAQAAPAHAVRSDSSRCELSIGCPSGPGRGS